MRKRFLIPNAFTSLNFLLGVWAICWSAGAFTPRNPEIPWYAFVMSSNFVIFCVLLDKLDGFAAKMMNASSEFGAQFDSLADLIAFGLAPAFGLFFAYKNLVPDWFHRHTALLVVSLSVYVLCAAMRLAKYNALDSDAYPDYFVGLPSTLSGSLNAVLLILFCQYGFFYESNKFLHLPAVILTASAILMVSPLFLPKLKKRKSKFINALQVINIIGAYTCGFAMVYPEYLLALVVIYMLAGFGYGIFHREHILAAEANKSGQSEEAGSLEQP